MMWVILGIAALVVWAIAWGILAWGEYRKVHPKVPPPPPTMEPDQEWWTYWKK